jgi:hypothetical protein
MTDRSNNLPTPTLVIEPAEIPVSIPAPAPTPMHMFELALGKGASVEILDKLLNLHERLEANDARRQFDAAIAATKAELPPIPKNRKGNYGAYADMAAIAGTIDPIITKHGLSYRFRANRVGNEVVMTCIIAHKAGHYEENSLPGPLDTSGSKNQIMALGSTCTYLQRYCLMQAFGLAAAEEFDDNGIGAGAAKNGIIGSRTSIMKPEDYSDGAPERGSKKTWRAKLEEWRSELGCLHTPEELLQWGLEHHEKVRAAGPETRDQYWEIFRKRREEIEAQEALDRVVYAEGEDPRPATVEDFSSISERAIGLREQTANLKPK